MIATQAPQSKGTDSITVRREIAATAEELFDAWLDVESLAEIMRPDCKDRATVTADARVGGTFEIMMHKESASYPHSGTYLVIDRPHVLEFTWISHATGNAATKVRVEFHVMSTDRDNPKTEVVLRHHLLPGEAAARAHTGGWTDILQLLDQYAAREG